MSALTSILGDHHSFLPSSFVPFFLPIFNNSDLFTQIFTEYQLCAEFHSWYWEAETKPEETEKSMPRGAYIPVGELKKKKMQNVWYVKW